MFDVPSVISVKRSRADREHGGVAKRSEKGCLALLRQPCTPVERNTVGMCAISFLLCSPSHGSSR